MRNIYCGVLFLFGLLLLSPSGASAQISIPPQDLNGYAWSNNIGWISFNCEQGGATGNDICGTSNYKVRINTDGSVTGYAWSNNVGWIRFGGLSGFPAWAGATQENVRVVLNTNYPNFRFTGFARACAGTLYGDCSSMSNSTTSGGWTGWIAMNGSSHSVLATADTGAMGGSSWAWGDLVVGWIDMFSRVTADVLNLSLTATGCQIAAGGSSCNGTATWNIPTGTPDPRVRNQTTNNQFSTSLTGTNVSVPLTGGNNTIQVRSDSTVLESVTVSAGCATGSSWDSGLGLCVSPPPTITIEAVPPVTRSTRSVSIRWTIDPDPLTDGTCRVNGPGISNMDNLTESGEVESATLTAKAQYRIQCTGSYGTVERTTTIDVIPEGGES